MKKVYAFIDSQNLNLGVRSEGWTIDYSKFRLYLRNKYNVDKAFIFIGLVQKSQHRRSVETLGLSGNGDTFIVANST